jgi:hypothetical protein
MPKINPKPFLWDEDKALNFFEIYNRISVHHPAGHPVSREIIALIFFEETAFSNVRQNKGSGPAVGFGQMEIYNHDKIPFFEWLGFNSDRRKSSRLPLITPDRIVNDNDFSVQLTCKYFQWLVEKQGKSTIGALQAQTGGGANLAFVPLWQSAEQELKKVIFSGDRIRIINALNRARSGGPHPNPIPLKQFKAYWDFTVPQSQVLFGIRK